MGSRLPRKHPRSEGAQVERAELIDCFAASYSQSRDQSSGGFTKEGRIWNMHMHAITALVVAWLVTPG